MRKYYIASSIIISALLIDGGASAIQNDETTVSLKPAQTKAVADPTTVENSPVVTAEPPSASSPTNLEPTETRNNIQSTPAADYQPSKKTIVRQEFIASTEKALDSYANIVSLLNFNQSDMVLCRSAIAQATALDKESTRLVFIRSYVNDAGITSGPYMEAVEKLESGTSSISVGLTFLGYWSENQRSADFEIGMDGVKEGAAMLLDLSNSLHSMPN